MITKPLSKVCCNQSQIRGTKNGTWGFIFSRTLYCLCDWDDMGVGRGRSYCRIRLKSLGKAGKAAAQTAKKSVNSVKQHFSPPKNRYTPALEGMLQRAGEAPNVKNTPLLRELVEDKKKSVLLKLIVGKTWKSR